MGSITLPQFNVRASRSARAIRCAASAEHGDGPAVDVAGPAAALGRAVHHWIATRLRGTTLPSVESLAETYEVETLDLERLVRFAEQAIDELSTWAISPSALIEWSSMVQQGRTTITATLDLGNIIAIDDEPIGVAVDFKSGYKEPGDWDQIKCQLRVLAEHDPSPEKFIGVICWLPDRTMRKRTFTRAELNCWAEALDDHLSKSGGSYSPGEHCEYCHRKADCPGLLEHQRQLFAIVRGDEYSADQIREVGWTAENRALATKSLIERIGVAKQVASLVDSFLNAVREDIMKFGAFESSDGARVYIEIQNMREIDPQKAWPVLADALPEEQLAECMTISVGKVEKAIASNAPRGQGKARKCELMNQLDSVGAISTKPRRLLKTESAD